MEKIVTERTNLLVDYMGKFINQPLAGTNPQVKVNGSRSAIMNNDDASKECVKKPIDVEDCVPYINYLKDKQNQLLDLNEVLEIITNYFVTAKERCDATLSVDRCKRLIVS